MENWFFSQSFTKYFLDFWLRSESIDLWKITPDLYNNFSDSGGGDVKAFPLPLPTLQKLQKFIEKFKSPLVFSPNAQKLATRHLNYFKNY